MSVSKYYTHVLPRFGEIRSWLWYGSTEREIEKSLGVSKTSFERYKRAFPELRELLSESKGAANALVARAAFDMAYGYTREVKKPIKVKETYYDENGHKCERERVEAVTVEEFYPPQPQPNRFWLMNRDPEHWRERVEAEISGEVEFTVPDILADRIVRAMGYGKES